MTRTLYRGTSVLFCSALLAFVMFGFAHANDHGDYRYDDDYNYDYRSYDNSVRHSFNNYDSFNYSYGYPYSNYAYSYPYYDYGGSYYYDGYNNYGYSHRYDRRPTCSISTYRTSGANPYDGRVTLTWWSSGATSAYLSGVGSVSVNGTQTMYGTQYSSYTLTVAGPGGSSSCSASSPYYDSGSHYYRDYSYGNYVSSPTFAYPVYSYPYVSGTVYPTYNYVQLSQTPYTGFDFGLFGNSLYWLAMILLAAAGAYFIVYSHSGSLPRAFAQEVATAARNQIRLVKMIVR